MSTPPQSPPDPVPIDTVPPGAAETGEGAVSAPADSGLSLEEPKRQRTRRRRLLAILGAMVALIVVFACLLVWYLVRPQPLPDILPVSVEYPPHYLYSIEGLNQPSGVALSPDGTKLYVTEVDGDREIKILTSDSGKLIRAFDPPTSSPSERAPVYLTVDSRGRVYVTDRLQHAIFVYSGNGDYLDTILDRNQALSGYVLKQAGSLPDGSIYYYNQFMSGVQYKLGGESEWKVAPPPTHTTWAPLGISISHDDRLVVTDVGNQDSKVLVYPAWLSTLASRSILPLDPEVFGSFGNGDGQMTYPNDAVTDSKGRFYVVDSNNGRITVWDANRQFTFYFGKGTNAGAFGLPRGAYIDSRDRLFIADAVDHSVIVYNVAGDRPVFLYSFGEHGQRDGQFNYPNDIVLSNSGKLFIADRANNRVQVWSY